MSVGKFISANLLDTKVAFLVDLDHEWLNYQDGNTISHGVLLAIPTAYDAESGVLTCRNEQGQVFYVNEEFINMFWEDSTRFSIRENTTSTIRPKKPNRDII